MSEPNYEEMSLDQLRDLALQHAVTPSEPEPEGKEEKPRDEKGRFAKPEAEEKKEEEKVEEVDEVVYERTIDLGDGAGVQVFRGKTMEELVDKLADAQKNATKKIREFAAREKAVKAVEDDEQLTDDQKYLLQQRMLSDPMSVINEFVEKKVTKLTKAQEEARRAEEEVNAQIQRDSDKFIEETPDYYKCPKNGERIAKWLDLSKKEYTLENFREAYQDLSSDGLLLSKPEEKQEDAEVEDEVQPARIERKTESTVVRRKVVGGSVSVKRSAPAPEKNTSGPTEEEISKMTTDQLRELAVKQVMGL